MVENSLFNQPLMNRYLKKYKKELNLTHNKKDAVLKWIKKLQNGELKDEVSNYGLFSRLILETILGYDYEENIEENVKEDYGRGFSEFALKKDGKRFMVIELKGSNSDLDKPQHRKSDKRTPVDQAFDYAKRSGDINWILVSNYDEFRLYNWHKKQHHYISFKAEELKDPEKFKKFMLVLSKVSVIEHNLLDKLVSKTIFVERDLEAEFYKLFNETRLMLIAELENIHPEFTRDQSVHYAQLILNRYIFICFAEDLGLLPEEISVETIENPIKNDNLGRSEIWHRLNSLFIDVNEGNDLKKEKIYGYNGGLFKEDLEFLKIRDVIDDYNIFKNAYQKWKFEEYSLIVEEKLGSYSGKINPIYKNLMTISTFNFSSEVDVNILGHIFENSIGDIEELKADEKGRRKKEGIFYTPEYITDYICRNTIIPYLSKSGKSNTVKDLIGEYWGSEIQELYEKTKNMKIVDPACGSGAFLNKASDVLLEIHQAIHEYQYKDDKTLMPFFDNIKERRNILLNNIFGVDLNEESVEITKLSLFLKVSRKGLKLPNLDKNIKCGNSLIEDPQFTDKPFKWETEFPEIFKDGGFDVVIGNPPYVRQEKIKDVKPYLKDHYGVYTGVADLYVYFFEKGIKILKHGGELGFICSNKFTKANYGKKLREFILSNSIFQIYFDHTYSGVFEDATTYPSVFIFKKDNNEDNQVLVNDEFGLEQRRLDGSEWSFKKPEVLDLKNKINDLGVSLKDMDDVHIHYGIKTGYNKAFVIDENTKNSIIQEDPKSSEIIKPILTGKDIKKWKVDYKYTYLIFTRRGIDIDCYPAIKKHLLQFKERLTPKNEGQKIGRKPGHYQWYELQDAVDYYEEFEKDKLIYPNLASSLFVYFDENKYYTNQKCFIITSDINLKYLGAILSSKVINFVFSLSGTPLQGNYYDLNKKYIENLPVYLTNSKEQEQIIKKTELILDLNQKLQQEVTGFKNWLKDTFEIVKLSKKLEKYYELSLNDFLLEVKKKKVDIKPRKTMELLKNEFEESLSKVNLLIMESGKINDEIDQMVFDLYGLTDEEIQIVKENLN